ncbi:hypothetical protein JCM17204_20920 [Blautia stercoris]
MRNRRSFPYCNTDVVKPENCRFLNLNLFSGKESKFIFVYVNKHFKYVTATLACEK